MRLQALAGRYAVARLPAEEPLPAWAALSATGELVSITRTDDELSIVCAEGAVPAEVRAERDFVGWRVAGVVDFAATGVLSSLTAPLAAAGVSVFALSTFDTDYLLVRARDRERAAAALASVAVLVDERQ